MAAINEFLALSIICNLLRSHFSFSPPSYWWLPLQIHELKPSFNNAKELWSHTEMLPKRLSWKC
jgi:hypothetical protein